MFYAAAIMIFSVRIIKNTKNRWSINFSWYLLIPLILTSEFSFRAIYILFLKYISAKHIFLHIYPSQHFNVGSTLFQCCGSIIDPTLKMKQNPTSDFQRCTTLIQRRCAYYYYCSCDTSCCMFCVMYVSFDTYYVHPFRWFWKFFFLEFLFTCTSNHFLSTMFKFCHL